MLNNNKISPENVQKPNEAKTPSFIFSVRLLVGFIMFLGFTVNYMQRNNLSIAIVCMVNSTAVLELENSNTPTPIKNNSINNPVCSLESLQSTSDGKFVWKKSDQGLILSSYFYGYIVTQILGGWLSMRFGPRWVIFYSMLLPSGLTLITPVIANLDLPPLLIVLRLLMGLLHGCLFSAIASLFSHWTPPKEKTRIMAFGQSGMSMGIVLASIFSGFLCDYGFYDGWGSIFIIFGAIGFIWCGLFFFLVSDSPLEHRFISQEERDYIISSIPHAVRPKKTPWVEIFKTRACWAIFITNFFFNWGGYLFLTQTPTFLRDVLNFDIQSNGVYSSLPFILSFILTLAAAITSDKLISHNILSAKTCRKLFNTSGAIIPMVMIAILGFIDCSQPLVGVALLTLGVGCTGLYLGAGFVVNINDIGGKSFSGVVYGISNTFGTLPGIIAPYFVGIMTPQGTAEEWRIVFIVTAVFFLIGSIPFLLFAEVEVQKWAISNNDVENVNSTIIDDDDFDDSKDSKKLEMETRKSSIID